MWSHEYSIEIIIARDFMRIDDILYNEFMHNPAYIDLSLRLYEYYGNQKRASLVAQLILWKGYAASN